MLYIIIILVAWVLDLIFADPAWLPHPVVAFGKWISFGEKRLNKGTHRMFKGAVFAIASITLVFTITLLINSFISSTFNPKLSTLRSATSGDASLAKNPLLLSFNAIMAFFCLAGHTLRREVAAVFHALDRSLDEGRHQVARIVGRDTQNLSAQEVRTAALETLAENLSDGVVAPIFWFAVAGLPGMLTYKMVNTLDSMIGYRNERYKDFGCWAARIDDVANYIPARLTALLMILPHAIRHASFSLFRFLRKYGPCHASPNSGWPEAALAGILDCRFGGTHDYFGQAVVKPYIGSNPRLLTTADLHTRIRVCFVAECLAIALTAALYIFAYLFTY